MEKKTDVKERKDSDECRTENSQSGDDQDLRCCFVVDPCGCYVDPCCTSSISSCCCC